jgi:uncharacterized protein YndB with AHSA1/START domain
MAKRINHKLFFPNPAEAVWEYLTKAELMEQWLMKSDFQLVVGHEFQFSSRPVPAIQFDGNVYCKVLEIIPFKKLSYSWKCGPGNGQILIDSIVVWTLNPKDNGTELLLEHSGFKENEGLELIAAMDKGWLANMKKIFESLNVAKTDASKS